MTTVHPRRQWFRWPALASFMGGLVAAPALIALGHVWPLWGVVALAVVVLPVAWLGPVVVDDQLRQRQRRRDRLGMVCAVPGCGLSFRDPAHLRAHIRETPR